MAIINEYFKEYLEDKKEQIDKFQSHCQKRLLIEIVVFNFNLDE